MEVLALLKAQHDVTIAIENVAGCLQLTSKCTSSTVGPSPRPCIPIFVLLHSSISSSSILAIFSSSDLASIYLK